MHAISDVHMEHSIVFKHVNVNYTRMRNIRTNHIVPYVLSHHFHHTVELRAFHSNSGFPSTRINLSPFTKDFRGGEQLE